MTPTQLGIAAGVTVAFGGLTLTQLREAASKRKVVHRLASQSDDRGRFVLPRWLPISHLLVVGVALITGAATNWLLAGAGAAGCAVLIGYLKSARVTRERKRYEKSLPIVFDDISRSLRSGASLMLALEDASGAQGDAVRRDLHRVVRTTSMGESFTEAMNEWQRRRQTDSVRLITAALTMSVESGGRQADVVDGLATTLRQRQEARAIADTAATDAKTTAVMLTVLPLLFSVPIILSNQHAQQFMLHSLVGNVILLAGLGLDALGAFVIARMIQRAT